MLEGGTKGGQKGELKQAEEVFLKVAELGRADGWVNLARVYQKEGRIPDALAALEKAAAHKEARGALGHQLAHRPDQRPQRRISTRPSAASSRFSQTRIPERKLDFSLDFEVNNELASALYSRARHRAGQEPRAQGLADEGDRSRTSARSRSTPRTSTAHYGLGLAFGDPAWGEKPAGLADASAAEKTAAVDPDAPARTGGQRSPIARRPRPTARSDRCELAHEVTRYMKGERPRFQSRLEPLHDLAATLGPVWERGDRRRRPDSRRPRPRGDPQGACTSGSSPTRRPRDGPSPSPARTTPPPTSTPSRS